MCAREIIAGHKRTLKRANNEYPAERMEDEVVIPKFPKTFKNKFSTNTNIWGLPFHTSVPRGTLFPSILCYVCIS